MVITVRTSGYNQRRYGKPWIAKVTFSTSNPNGNFEWGTWLGNHNIGSNGELVINANEEDIVAKGQKDFRNPKHTECDYFQVRNGKLVYLDGGKAEAYHLATDVKN